MCNWEERHRQNKIFCSRYRDIAIWCYLFNEDKNKSLGLKFSWDANRDPNQKLLITANYKKNADFNYLADIILSYPGRTVKGDYKFSLESEYNFYVRK